LYFAGALAAHMKSGGTSRNEKPALFPTIKRSKQERSEGILRQADISEETFLEAA
jgi:hypothetical protein